jgi:hypothetical protein
MESTSEPENDRHSRGLGHFRPVPEVPAPAPRQSDEDRNAPPGAGGAAPAPASDQPAGAAGPTGEHPQLSDQQSGPRDDQQGSDEAARNPFESLRPHSALTSDTQMVALGSRRPADTLLGMGNGSRWHNQGGFPPAETNGHHNGDTAPWHSGAPVANGRPPAGGPVPGARSPFDPGADDDPLGSRSPFGLPGDNGPEPRSPFPPAMHGDSPAGQPPFPPATGDTPSGRSPFPPATTGDATTSRSPFPPATTSDATTSRSPFPPATTGDATTGRSPFGSAETDAGAVPFGASPFAPQASGSAPVDGRGAEPAGPAHPLAPGTPEDDASSHPRQSAAAPSIPAQPASGSAQVPASGRPVSAAPAAPAPAGDQQAAPPAPNPLKADTIPTRLEPSGWATGPQAVASASAAVPVSAPGGGRRSRDGGDEPRTGSGRRAAGRDDAEPRSRRAGGGTEIDGALRPGDVHESPITFWNPAASEQLRAEWHEVKAQFVDDPVSALTRAHDLITEAVHELTESMLAERDQLDPLGEPGTPDTESMRMAMRGYREFLDRILTL